MNLDGHSTASHPLEAYGSSLPCPASPRRRFRARAKTSTIVAFETTSSWRPSCKIVCAICGRMPIMMQSVHQACRREDLIKCCDQGVELWDECCWKMRIAIAWRTPCLLPCPDFHWAGCRDARAGSATSNRLRQTLCDTDFLIGRSRALDFIDVE